MSSPHDDSNMETRPNRPVSKTNLLRSTQETLPKVDWEISSDRRPLSFPRPDNLTVGLVQFFSGDDKQANIQRALGLAWQAADAGAEIIAFPEMFMLPWVFAEPEARYQNLAETMDSTIWEQFKMLAHDKQVVLVCSFFERGMEGRFYNSTLIIDTDGTVVGRYRKHHLPPDNERLHWIPDSSPFSSFPTRKGRIGVYICWDNFFPEGARALALDHADIVFGPSAATEEDAAYKWKVVFQHNAMINGIPWVRINRIEPPCYPASYVVNAEGQIIHEVNTIEEGFSLATVDLTLTDRVRKQWTFMEDRRPEMYRIITER
jgi:predicted amidohydrolase